MDEDGGNENVAGTGWFEASGASERAQSSSLQPVESPQPLICEFALRVFIMTVMLMMPVEGNRSFLVSIK